MLVAMHKEHIYGDLHMFVSDPYLYKALTSKPCPNNNYNDDDNNTVNNPLPSTSIVTSEHCYKLPF